MFNRIVLHNNKGACSIFKMRHEVPLYLSVRSQFLEKCSGVSAPAPYWWPREVYSSGRTHHRESPEPGGPGYGYSRPGQSGYLSPLPNSNFLTAGGGGSEENGKNLDIFGNFMFRFQPLLTFSRGKNNFDQRYSL